MSLQARACHCSVSFTKAFSRYLWGKQLSSPPDDKTFPSHLLPGLCLHLMMPNFLFYFSNICIEYFPPFFHSGPSPHRNLLQSHADSWFVYQNIDLLSLYTSTLALLLVHFFSFSPLPKAPLMGHPFLVIDLPAKQLLMARGTRERQGSIHLGILVPNWQCRPLC